jgi:hypothetical protein
VGHNGAAIAATNTIAVSPGDLLTMAARMRSDSYLSIGWFSLNYDLDGDDEFDVVSPFQWAGVPINEARTVAFAPTNRTYFYFTTATLVSSFQGTISNLSGKALLPPAEGTFVGGYQMGTVVWKANVGVNNDGADITALSLSDDGGFFGCPDNNPCTGKIGFTEINNAVRFNSATVNLVPEPRTSWFFLLGLLSLGLLSLGLVGLVLLRRRRS